MIQRKLHYLLTAAIAFAFCSQTKAQLYINSATFFIQPGATVTVQGDVTSNTDIQGTGTVILNGSGNQNVNMAGATIPNLQVNNSSNVTLTSDAQVSGTLTFTSGKILLGNSNLKMGSGSSISGASASQYVVTNGGGKLVKAALGSTAFNFPVGNSTSTYNPVSISNSGTADSIGVRALANAFTNGLTGTAFTKEAVDASWDISESVAGGSNLSVTATWAASDELPNFDRTKTGLSYYITAPAGNVGWDLTNAQLAAATGSNPYSVTRTGITSVGTFAVGFRPVLTPLLVTPTVFLQGAYNTSTGLMNDNLRTLNLIPTTEPYTGMAGFTHTGSGGKETTTSTVFSTTGNTAVVDWVFVQLHRASDSVVVSSRAALLLRNGSIVETDGVSPLNMGGNLPGTYYISVRHRNHLGIRTSATITLAKTTNTSYNFTSGIGQVYTKGITNNAMATLSGGVYGMWAGNANSDILVKMSGISAASNDYLKLLSTVGSNTGSISNTYSVQDLNMDGTVKMSGITAASNDYLRLLNVVGSNTTTITQPSF